MRDVGCGIPDPAFLKDGQRGEEGKRREEERRDTAPPFAS